VKWTEEEGTTAPLFRDTTKSLILRKPDYIKIISWAKRRNK
jgi:hypothetical protein